jgi:hypothetical protein
MKSFHTFCKNIVIGLVMLNALLTPEYSFAVGEGAEGFSCVIMGRAGKHVETSSGIAVDIPVRLINCEGVRILSEGLSACFTTERRERRCVLVKKNERISKQVLGGTSAVGVTDNLIAMIKGDIRSFQGQTRASKPPAGLPFGQTIGYEGIRFDASESLGGEVWKRFFVTPDSAPDEVLWEADIPSATGKIPLDRLRTDSWYQWHLQLGDRALTGRFYFVGSSADRLRDTLHHLDSDTSLTADAKLYLQAEMLNEAGFIFERQQWVRRLRELIQTPK